MTSLREMFLSYTFTPPMRGGCEKRKVSQRMMRVSLRSTHNRSQNHSVELESVEFVSSESLLDIRFDRLLDQIPGELVGIRPDLLEDSVEPLATFDVWEEHPCRQVVESRENDLLVARCRASFRHGSPNIVLGAVLIPHDTQQQRTQKPCDAPVHVTDKVHDADDGNFLDCRVDDRHDAAFADLLVQLSLLLRQLFAVRHLRYHIRCLIDRVSGSRLRR